MVWYERFGYERNPFELSPFKSEYTLINHIHLMNDLQHLLKSGRMFVLFGSSGSGKTMFLKQIVEKYPTSKYIDASKVKKETNIENLIKGKSKLFGLIKSKPKKGLLLIDNAENLSERNLERIKYYFDQDHLQSVVFATVDPQLIKMSQSVRDRIMDQIITIPPMNQFEAVRIVRERFNDHFFLSDEVILKIFKLANNNMKQTLLYCNEVCSFVVKEGRGEVLPKYLSILKKKTTEAKKKIKVVA